MTTLPSTTMTVTRIACPAASPASTLNARRPKTIDVVPRGPSWAAPVGAVLLRDDITGPPEWIPALIVEFYTGALVILLGLTALVASGWLLETTAGCVLVTILLVAGPSHDESRLMIAERTLGTLIGGIARLQLLIGTAAMVVAALLQLLHARYRLLRDVRDRGDRAVQRDARQRLRRRRSTCTPDDSRSAHGRGGRGTLRSTHTAK
jgi:hypothetical protein